MQATLKREMAAVDATLPLAGFRTMDDLMTRSVASQRFYMLLLGLFALLGLLLAAVGIYGVMSQAVAERTNEIGIRMALGAARRDVLALVLGQGMKLTLLGVVVGLAASLGLTRLMQGFLFGVSATNPLTFVVVTIVLTAVAGFACWLPARRATQVDPLTALRYE
jgi:putative ABC transport system permease protein